MNAHPDEVAFHKMIENDPRDGNTFLIYADWLEDHGRPGMAAVIRANFAYRRGMEPYLQRQHEERGGTTGLVVNPNTNEMEEQGNYRPRPITNVHRIGTENSSISPEQLQRYLDTWHIDYADVLDYGSTVKDRVHLSVNHVSRSNPIKHFYYTFYTDPSKASYIIRRLAEEGHHVLGINKEATTVREENKAQKARRLLAQNPDKTPQQFRRKKYAMPKPFTTPAKTIVGKHPKAPNWMRPLKVKGSVVPGMVVPKGKVNTVLHPSLHGTRLAVDLHEIRDRLGAKDPELKRLADIGLRGAGDIGSKNDVYTLIRNRLLGIGSGTSISEPLSPKRAVAPFTEEESNRATSLARGYNWHRMGAAISTDEAVSDYINSIASDKLKSNNAQHRAAHNLFGIGWDKREKPTSPEARAAFMKGLSEHVRKRAVGPDSVYGLKGSDVNEQMLLRSMRRLGQAEQQRDSLALAKPTSKVSSVGPVKPAWHPGPGLKNQVRLAPKVPSGQYRRRIEARRYAMTALSSPQEEPHPYGGYVTEDSIIDNPEHNESDFNLFQRPQQMQRRKYTAYRAPAGGIVARGTFYQGGKMMPDMEGKFMAPVKKSKEDTNPTKTAKFDPKKLAEIRKKLRNRHVKKVGTVKELPPPPPGTGEYGG